MIGTAYFVNLILGFVCFPFSAVFCCFVMYVVFVYCFGKIKYYLTEKLMDLGIVYRSTLFLFSVDVKSVITYI